MKLFFFLVSLVWLSPELCAQEQNASTPFREVEEARVKLSEISSPLDFGNEANHEKRVNTFRQFGPVWFGVCANDFEAEKLESKEGEITISGEKGFGVVANVYFTPENKEKSYIKTVPIIAGLNTVAAVKVAQSQLKPAKGDNIIKLELGGKIRNWRSVYDSAAKDVSPYFSTPDRQGQFFLYSDIQKKTPELGFQMNYYTNREDEKAPRTEILFTAFCAKQEGCDVAGKHFKEKQPLSICFYSRLTTLEDEDAVLPKK